MKPAIVFHGNCQSLAFYSMAIRDVELVGQYTLALLRVSDPSEPVRRYEILSTEPVVVDELLANCAIFLQQKSFWDKSCAYADKLPAHCRKVSFPLLSHELLWPFYMLRPYPRPYGLEDNRRCHGDRIFHGLLKKKLPPLDTLARFMTTDIRQFLDLDRSRDLYFDKMRDLDREVDVSVAGLIEDLFRHKQLFVDITHPTTPFFYHMAARIFQCADMLRGEIQQNWDGHLSFSPTFPIHPQIIDHYGITWVNHSTRYGFHGPRPYPSSVYVERYNTKDGDYGYVAGLRRHLELPDVTPCTDLEEAFGKMRTLQEELTFWDALPDGPMAGAVATWRAELLTALGDCHQRLGAADQAKAFYQRALQLGTTFYPLLPSLVAFLERENRHAEALALLHDFIHGPNMHYGADEEKEFLAGACVRCGEALAQRYGGSGTSDTQAILQQGIQTVNACLGRILEVADRKRMPPLHNIQHRLGQTGDLAGQTEHGLAWSYEKF
ncbi:MAG: hypothetical protein HQL63_04490 [Magnetococcales bacterium]|nr:hypothetical protein [Magnetococcales bacterium]